MECHAWVVTIPVGKWNKAGCQQLRKKYPKLIRKIGEDGFMDPEQPGTADYLAEVCRDIATRYDVDGIHLDYIRYPETWPKPNRHSPLAQRREHITNIVRRVSETVRAVKPWVKMSCSPVGKYDDLTRYKSGGWNARTAVAQDAQLWLREGLMDALFPMMYFKDNQFFPFAIDWQEQRAGRIVCPGLGIYFLDPREGKWTLPVVEREMNVLRQIGAGHAYFRSKFLTDNTKGVYDFVCRFDAVPALVPPMTWATTSVPGLPGNLQLSGTTLSWTAASDDCGAPYILYNVYASTTYPVDTEDAHTLVAWRLTSTALNVPADRYYAVRAMNRYGVEGPAVQMVAPDANSHASMLSGERLFRVGDSQQLRLPHPATLDAAFIVVENMQGRHVATLPWTSSAIDLAQLPDGMYQLRSLGRKGRTHRLGFLYKRQEQTHELQ